ncbi:methyltransferase domain-containing protein [Pararobbsia silviterrae]|nr:methyltransferase domain-containing protein [Pararobbsia silviterrae]
MEETQFQSGATQGRLIVILGMHRSGTSAITRAMATLGADFGDNLMPAVGGNNEKGFFEDVDVNRLNIELMNALGIEWHSIRDFDLERLPPAVLDGFQIRALTLLRGKINGRIFALKDPRIARLMAFWKPVFDRVGVPVSYVIAVRNPMSVVQSLAKRDGFTEELSYLLWLAHVVPALIATRDVSRVLVDYDTLLDAPGPELERMAREMGLALDARHVQTFSEEFLEGGLRHTRFQPQDLDLVRVSPPAVAQLFQALDRACRGASESDALVSAVERGRALLRDLTPILQRVEAGASPQVGNLQKQIAERDRAIQTLSNGIQERDRVIAESQRQLQALAGQFKQSQDLVKQLVQHEAEQALNAIANAGNSAVAVAPPTVHALDASGPVLTAPQTGGPAMHADLSIAPATTPISALRSNDAPVVPVVSSVTPSTNKKRPKGVPDAIFSFIVDVDTKFAYQGYYLAHSLIEHSCDHPSEVHVQFTPEVGADVRDVFVEMGCSVHQIERFGDGRYCNKIAQLANLHAYKFGKAVLLDTDTIVLADIRPFLRDDALMAKVVDFPNPSTDVLDEIGRLAKMKRVPQPMQVDASDDVTYVGNCNGGFYSIPKAMCEMVDEMWRTSANWLLKHMEPLRRAGKEIHVDQISMWLAINVGSVPYRNAPSNLNYFIHTEGKHRYLNEKAPIAMMHYHDSSIGVTGKLEPRVTLDARGRDAVLKANAQMDKHFHSTLFWNFRYAHFIERGSGVGSRGENLQYKRELLIENGAQDAESVLDVGCGDLEVVKGLALRNYVGLDTSDRAIEVARRAKPDWQFQLLDGSDVRETIPSKDLVLCFEVLIHQPTRSAYEKLVDLLVDRTQQTLIVSGYAADYLARAANAMLFFYEPLEESLRKSGKFKSIRKIGAHSDVTVFRCDVEPLAA